MDQARYYENREDTNTVNVVTSTDATFMSRVYAFMGAGLLTTAVVAGIVANSPQLLDALLSNIIVFYGLMITELLLVGYLSIRLMKMSFAQAATIFFLYSMLNGLTFSLVFIAYTASSIASVFLVSAGMFAAVSIYGYITKRDLSGVGHFANMTLVGLILAWLVNLFLKNDGFSLFLSCIAVVVFVALTAYDTQKIRNMNSQVALDGHAEKNVAIFGALKLYLDFLNIFLNLLRIMGNRK